MRCFVENKKDTVSYVLNTPEEYISSGILEQFVLGEMPEAEAQEVADMAARYPNVRHELNLIEDTLQGLAESLAIEPPPGVFDKIKNNIIVTAKEPSGPAISSAEKKARKLPYWQYGVAATFTLKLIVMALAAGYWINWKNTEQKLGDLQERYDRLEQSAQQSIRALLDISNPAFQTVVLQNQAPSGSLALAYWNPETYQIYLDLSQFPPNETDQQYLLEGIAEGDTIRLGTFNVTINASLPQTKHFKGVVRLSDLLISRESADGSTSPPLYRATLP
jgi:hypothetical protein